MTNFKRIFDLIKKTGDKFIIQNNDDDIYVVMDIHQYENLVLKDGKSSGNKEDLVSQINEDVTAWKNQETETPSDVEVPTFSENLEEEDVEEEDKYYFEPEEEAF